MNTQTSEGVTISVKTGLEDVFPSSEALQYLFSYTIRIENNNPYPVRLMSRHWTITDSGGEVREVQGDGVVGEQPVIHPGEDYEYSSACDLSTEIGKMQGSYFMRREEGDFDEEFEVEIPDLRLTAPARLN
ncbi:MAG: Co2+/Mg2+ efflux protein ApaG [Flavobacteriales bacterium]